MQNIKSKALKALSLAMRGLVLATIACAHPNSPDPSVRLATVPAPAPLTLTLSVPSATSLGATVTITLSLHNSSSAPIMIGLAGPPEQEFDVVVFDGTGREVWSRLRHDTMLDILLRGPLGAGESRMFTATWNQTDNGGRRVAPGAYRIQGIVREIEFSQAPGGIRSADESITIGQ